jgi:hypothetical protein
MIYQVHSRQADSGLSHLTTLENLYAFETTRLSLTRGLASSLGARNAFLHYCSHQISLANPEWLFFCLYID